MTERSACVLDRSGKTRTSPFIAGRQHGSPSRLLAVALAAELDSAWVPKPLALTRHEGRTILILMDPRGEPLDRVLPRGQPLDLTRVLHTAIGLPTALGQVQRRGLMAVGFWVCGTGGLEWKFSLEENFTKRIDLEATFWQRSLSQ